MQIFGSIRISNFDHTVNQSWLGDGIFSGSWIPNSDPGDSESEFFILGYIKKSRNPRILGIGIGIETPEKSRDFLPLGSGFFLVGWDPEKSQLCLNPMNLFSKINSFRDRVFLLPVTILGLASSLTLSSLTIFGSDQNHVDVLKH